MHVKKADYEYTGGGCYTYYGALDNGEFFVFGQNKLAILDEDFGVTLTSAFFEETDGDSTDWEKEHLLREYEYPSKEADPVIKETFRILTENVSDGVGLFMLDMMEKELAEDTAAIG